MAVGSLFPMLVVDDLAASVAFYRDLLGGVPDFAWPVDDPVFVTLRLGESLIGIGVVGEGPVHGVAQRPVSGHRVELCVYVDDVDDVVTTARRAGAHVVTEPRDQPWGERMAYVADPDGNLLMVVTPSDTAPA